jgi:RNA polymerase sigma-70 factor (ECF subfamily)
MPSTEEVDTSALQAVCRSRAEPFMPTTEELVTAVRVGDTSAFGKLVRLYERAAIITAHSVLHDYDKAQDAAQEGFMIAYTKLNQLSVAAAFGPWLLKIVRHRAGHMQRERRTIELRSEIDAAGSAQSSEWIHRYEETMEQIGQLPEHERMVVVLRYVDGHSVQAIADTTGRPVGTITKQLSRALGRLRKLLREVPS